MRLRRKFTALFFFELVGVTFFKLHALEKEAKVRRRGRRHLVQVNAVFARSDPGIHGNPVEYPGLIDLNLLFVSKCRHARGGNNGFL